MGSGFLLRVNLVDEPEVFLDGLSECQGIPTFTHLGDPQLYAPTPNQDLPERCDPSLI